MYKQRMLADSIENPDLSLFWEYKVIPFLFNWKFLVVRREPKKVDLKKDILGR